MRTAALALLAGRDFSRHELEQRLRRKGHEAPVVEAAVADLVQEGLLRETRYLENFVSQHAARGHGPLRIRAELREKGIAPQDVDQALESSGTDWLAAAQQVRRRKFGSAVPAHARERARQARFLQYRGFTSEQVRAALGRDDAEPSSW